MLWKKRTQPTLSLVIPKSLAEDWHKIQQFEYKVWTECYFHILGVIDQSKLVQVNIHGCGWNKKISKSAGTWIKRQTMRPCASNYMP